MFSTYSIPMAKLLFWLEKKLAARFLLLLKRSIKFRVVNQEASDGIRCIYMFWHRNLLLMTLQRIYKGAAVMVSSSKDGELIAGPLSELGYYPVRGSSTRQGSKAMLDMIRASRTMSLAITPDGPKGPSFSFHPGVFQIALLAKIPIVAIAAHAEREWLFNSWDRFRFPKPFSTLNVVYSDPISLDSKEDIPAVEAAIRQFMNDRETEFEVNK